MMPLHHLSLSIFPRFTQVLSTDQNYSSFSWLSNIPWNAYLIICLSRPLVPSVCAGSTSWLVQTVL